MIDEEWYHSEEKIRKKCNLLPRSRATIFLKYCYDFLAFEVFVHTAIFFGNIVFLYSLLCSCGKGKKLYLIAARLQVVVCNCTTIIKTELVL